MRALAYWLLPVSIYSMLKKERNVTENEKKSIFFVVHFGLIAHIKKVRPAARSKASLTRMRSCIHYNPEPHESGAVYVIRQTKKG